MSRSLPLGLHDRRQALHWEAGTRWNVEAGLGLASGLGAFSARARSEAWDRDNAGGR